MAEGRVRGQCHAVAEPRSSVGKVQAPHPNPLPIRGRGSNRLSPVPTEKDHATVSYAPGVAPRRGFTLIEVLVVITIIAILAGLATMAIMSILSKGPDVADMDDIKELERNVAKFKVKYEHFPPDYIKLCHTLAEYNQTNALDLHSVQYLTKIWPKLFNNGPKYQIPWAGRDSAGAVVQLPNHPSGQQCVILQGDQCLVLFLGGPLGTQGFSTSMQYPIESPFNTAIFPNKSERVIFHEFSTKRLRARKTTSNPARAWMPMDEFPSYYDNYPDKGQQPFVYFVSTGNKNYNHLFNLTKNPAAMHTIEKIDGVSDVSPYHQAVGPKGDPRNYLNPDAYQIICAGKDAKFGSLGQWSNGQSAVGGNDWKDNRGNFHPHHLGVPQ